jgi:hypothetical protein
MALNFGITDELESIWKEAILAYSRYYPSKFLEGLRKATRNFNEDNIYPSRDPQLTTPKYEPTLPVH